MRIIALLILTTLWHSYAIKSQIPCSLDGVFINAMLIDPSGATNDFDTNFDGLVNSNDEFIELCNNSDFSVDLSNWQIGDDDPPPYPDYSFPESTILASGDCLLLVANFCLGDTLNCELPDNVLDMELEFLGLLGNSGDIIQLSDTLGNTCSVSYGAIQCEDVDELDLPGFDLSSCDFWGPDLDGCPLLSIGDSCEYIPASLPVKFLDFKGFVTDRQMIGLNWKTAEEFNNRGYNVQWKSNYEDSYRTIQWIDANPEDQEFYNYVYLHENPSSGTNYYRLQQIDYNGSSDYSNSLVLNLNLNDEFTVYPTLVEDRININGNSDVFLVSVYSFQGELILEKIKKRNNEFLDLSLLQNGYYVMRVFNGVNTKNFKFLKI